MHKKFSKILVVVLVLPILALATLLIYSTITDYKPLPGSVEILPLSGDGKAILVPDTFTVLIWNIGYGGLGAEMDFFHDGGRMVRPSEEKATEYLQGITRFLQSKSDSVDFMLLQEVDRHSKRSYFTDQMKVIGESLPDFFGAYAPNYLVRFVPVPFRIPYQPYGETSAGLASFSKYRPYISYRVQYPGGFSWPTSLYMLDRCALEQHFLLKDKRELVVVNTHNTAYDETGKIKQEEMAFIKNRYNIEAAKKKTILLGGDWNQSPPNYRQEGSQPFPEGYTAQTLNQSDLPDKFIAVSGKSPTNRTVKTPYQPGKSFTTLIDYFLTSPDLKLISIKTIDLEFKWSDHQPVIATLATR